MSEQLPSNESASEEGRMAGTIPGYRIEARVNYSQPKQVNGMLLDNRWRVVHFPDAPIGVPRGSDYSARHLLTAGCYDYAAAQALRWWFHAEARKTHDDMCLETRLVKYEIKHETTWKAVSTHAEIGGEDRSNLMPDWGKK